MLNRIRKMARRKPEIEKWIGQFLQKQYGYSFRKSYNEDNARFIAARLREGVVWESVGPATHNWLEADSYNITCIKDEEHENVQVIIECPEDDDRQLIRDGIQGQRVRVCVFSERPEKADSTEQGEGDETKH